VNLLAHEIALKHDYLGKIYFSKYIYIYMFIHTYIYIYIYIYIVKENIEILKRKSVLKTNDRGCCMTIFHLSTNLIAIISEGVMKSTLVGILIKCGSFFKLVFLHSLTTNRFRSVQQNGEITALFDIVALFIVQ